MYRLFDLIPTLPLGIAVPRPPRHCEGKLRPGAGANASACPAKAQPTNSTAASPPSSPFALILCDKGLRVLLKRKKQKARPKGVNLKVRWRAKVAMRYCSEESARRAILVWECRDRPPRRSVGKGACACSCGYDPTPGQGSP